MDDVLHDLLVDDRQLGPKQALPVTDRRPSIVCLAEKNGKSVPNSSLCSTRYSIALTSAWYSSQRRVTSPEMSA